MDFGFNPKNDQFKTLRTDPVRDRADEYGANPSKLTQLFVSGFVASAAMLAVAYFLPLLGVPSQDYAALGGAIFNGQIAPPIYSALWWTGLVLHMLLGTFAFPLLYDLFIDKGLLPNRPVLKGLLFGGLLWFVTEAILKVASGDGFFSSNMPYPAAIATVTLLTFLGYGLVLERMTRVRVVHALHERERRAA